MKHTFGRKFLIPFTLGVTLTCCDKIDYRKVKVDYLESRVSILDTLDFVIDSVSISRFDKLYYTTSLQNKKLGSPRIFWSKNNFNYRVYKDSLSALKCDDEMTIGIFIRKTGHLDLLTAEIAKTQRHSDVFRTFIARTFRACSLKPDTVRSDGLIY